MSLFFRVLVVWVVLILAETVHGVLRNELLAPLIGDFRSRQVGVFFGSLLIFTITLLLIRWINAPSWIYLVGMGTFWVFFDTCI